MKKIFLLLLILISLAGFSQTLDYKVEKPEKLFIGTPFHLLVKITSAVEDSIFAPKIDTLDIFILRGKIKELATVENEKKVTDLDLTFLPFNTGEYTFPELEFAVKTADSLHILKTSSFILHINSLVADSSKTIKDIAAPVSVNLSFWDIAIPIAVLAALILLIIYLKKFLRKKEEVISKPKIVDNRPPYIIALELLAKLKRQKLLEKGDFLNFYFQLSYILRIFLELKYKFNAVEMTTSEIRENLVLDDFKEKSRILEFMNAADKVKFAKFIPNQEESKTALQWLENYLKSFEKREKSETTSEKENA